MFYEVLARCLFEDVLRVRCAIFDVFSTVLACQLALKLGTSRAKVILLNENVNSVREVLDFYTRLEG